MHLSSSNKKGMNKDASKFWKKQREKKRKKKTKPTKGRMILPTCPLSAKGGVFT